MYLLSIIVATIVVVLIAIYLGTNRKETENLKDFSIKEKNFKVKEPEKFYNQNQTQSQNQKNEEKQSELNQEKFDQQDSDLNPPFQSPSEPEVL
jgi:hypothetical protein